MWFSATKGYTPIYWSHASDNYRKRVSLYKISEQTATVLISAGRTGGGKTLWHNKQGAIRFIDGSTRTVCEN